MTPRLCIDKPDAAMWNECADFDSWRDDPVLPETEDLDSLTDDLGETLEPDEALED